MFLEYFQANLMFLSMSERSLIARKRGFPRHSLLRVGGVDRENAATGAIGA